jgi:hypothetical protein
VIAHRGLRFREPAAAALELEESHSRVRSGEHQIRPAGDDAEPLQPARSDRIAISAGRHVGEPPARIDPSPDNVDQESLRGEFAWCWWCRAALPAAAKQMQLPGRHLTLPVRPP